MGRRTFIIGDVHGCLDMLERLMEKIGWDTSSDRLIYVGDYIDRGYDSFGVVEYIVRQTSLSQSVECVAGNHEIMLLDYLSGKDPELFFYNGGGSTIRSYRLKRESPHAPLFPNSHLKFFNSLKPFIDIGTHLVVHAGFMPGVPLEEQSLADMIWIREPFISSSCDFGKKVVFGHTPFKEPLIMDNKVGIDTGAVYGNMLTCLELPAERFHSVGRTQCGWV
ncbi:MAG: serine/threonine protein phosphatase [Desulfobacteraceae bacterium]|jgi:serine/threonine protein phosphatase 1|nr:MAG: serine/threonine protein phosphatase [Desulfobacteraceae bacterium]